MNPFTRTILIIGLCKPFLDNLWRIVAMFTPACDLPDCPGCESDAVVWFAFDMRWYVMGAFFAVFISLIPFKDFLFRYVSAVIALDCMVDLIFLLANGDHKDPLIAAGVYLGCIFYGIISWLVWKKRMNLEVKHPRPDRVYEIDRPPILLHSRLFRRRKRSYYSRGRVYRLQYGGWLKTRGMRYGEILVESEVPADVMKGIYPNVRET